MRKLLIGTFAGLMLATGTAAAQQIHEAHLQQLDADGNGVASKAEYEAFMNSAFDHLDANKNGSLTAQEASSVLSAEQFATVDANKNGRITRQEFINQVMTDFAAADRNKDGRLQ